MDVSQYLEIFIDETKEHLESLNNQLLILEKEPENEETVNEIFRAAHSLKGMAGTMGYKRMQRLTHDMENVFSEVRSGKMKINANIVDIVFQCLDALEAYLTNIMEFQDEGTEDNEPIIARLNAVLKGGADATVSDLEGGSKEQKTAALQETAKEDGAGGKNYKTVKLKDFELHAAKEAVNAGMKFYGITVSVDENCILKSARAFLVFKNLEPHGEIICSVPSAQDIEDEKFDFDFSLFVISKEPYEEIYNAIMGVSEIKGAVGEELSLAEEADQGTVSEEKKEEKPVAEETKTQAAQVQTPEKPANLKQTPPNNAANGNSGKPVVNRSVRVDIEKLDVLMNLVSELIIAKNGIVSVSDGNSGAVSQNLREQVEYLESITTNLHESVMKVRMVPIESVVSRFPRMIRDLSKKLNKKMELFMSGEDTELDRTVIDEIGDPLMHILRNSADHGLESAQVRRERGKPEVGSIFLDAYQDGNNVVIEVRDDGNGIDVEQVKRKAVEKGALTQEQVDNLDDKGAIDLLFRPSFSTAEKITDVSGRGVGLDVVRTKIEGLGGDIEVKTELGAGSTFIIRLPLTLAIIQSLMVILGDEKYAIPLSTIQTLEDVSINEIKYVSGKEVIHLRGKVIPLIRLNEVLDVESSSQSESLIVVIIQKGEKLAGLVVDELIGQQEIVIKSLGKYLNSNKLISGATILGDGEVALILDPGTLF
ncbi:MAG: chemotaxis protein CheA [Lachnospiraceae bacterium]|nr:chemotaxis protein CheA [Lachnospiraceae bacterium]